jgi:DUF917 family protein
MPVYVKGLESEAVTVPAYYTDNDLADLLFGLGLGASGGGGGYTIGQALVSAIIREIPSYRRVLTPVSQALDGDFAVMAGGIGAPSAITPGTITSFADYAMAAINAYRNEKGVNINALVPVEAGPVNALLALYLGWKYGLKVFDCDGAGRAVPSLTNLVFGYNAYPIAPLYLAGVKSGQPGITAGEVLPPPKDAAAAEAAIRDNLPQYGNAAGLVCWGQSGAQLRTSSYLIADQFDILRDLGSKLRNAISVAETIYILRQSPLVDDVYVTRLDAIHTDPRPGYDDGMLVFTDLNTSAQMKIQYENENMLMFAGDRIVTAPNGISMIFQTNRGLIPLNNGDDLQKQGLIGALSLVIVLKERCVLYNGGVGASFANVLKADPFNYKGPLQPTECV